MGIPGRKLLLIGKQLIVHLPVFTLLAGTMGGLRCLKSQRVDGFEREVENSVLQLTGANIVFLNLRIRPPDVTSTVGSLIVRELDEGEHRACFAFDWLIT